MRRQQSAGHPSFRSIRLRSSSLPRLRLSRQQDELNRSHHGSTKDSTLEEFSESNSAGSSGVRSWAQALGLGTSRSSREDSSFFGSSRSAREEDADDEERSLAPPHRKRVVRRTPVLTLALLKLDEHLITYCRHLADPSYENVEQACSLLDSSVATASTDQDSPSYHYGSPAAHTPTSPSRLASPSRSPITSWLTGGGTGESPSAHHHHHHHASPASSALILEGEWEKFVTPLFLLAGAEAIYASLGHYQLDVARNLVSLYQRIGKDLQGVREMLCDPFLSGLAPQPVPTTPPSSSKMSTEQPEPSTIRGGLSSSTPENPSETLGPTLAMYYERASSLATSLQALHNLCLIRCQVIRLSSTLLWDTPKPKFGDLARAFYELLPALPREASRAFPVVKVLGDELQTWKYLMETAFSVERCRYVFRGEKYQTNIHTYSKL